MQRVGFEMKIHPEMVEEYKRRHDDIWPEMSAALVRTGWRNYTIFFKDDGTLFGYVECEESFEASLEGMSQEEVNQKWQGDMSPFFQLPKGAHPDKNMIQWREVFHAD
jgi:L-rhamnose mutarotase|tara:strand:+ start:37 stop:360 length:324 start_codon:yes stop_codon:yes gene_type:complete